MKFPRLTPSRTILCALLVSALSLGSVEDASATRVLLTSNGDLDATVASYLTARGLTTTLVSASAFATADFSLYDAIWMGGWASDGFADRQADLTAFVNGGGNLLATMSVLGQGPSELPGGGVLTMTGVNADDVHVLNPLNPVNAGLTDANLSGWGQSYHSLFTSIGDFTPLSQNGSNTGYITLTKSFGQGIVTYTTQDIEFHAKNGNGSTGPNSSKIDLAYNALTAEGLLPPIPEPTTALFGAAMLGVVGLSRRRSVKVAA